ncbi:MarR family transcriptional regulator [Gordonia sp. HY442]|nr:MarR family transcriptional regulator [Gordonia zhenghanii]MCF8608111.1 MarR family transcriptional regulator [Gordonia zhenghanii]
MGSVRDENDPIARARSNWEDAGWGDAVADGMEAVTSVMRAHQIMLARVENELKPFGLTFARFELLRLLAFSRAGALPISKTSDLLQVHVSSATSAVARLVEAGLVERRPHPTDGRTTLVAITESGREVVEKATVALNVVFADIGLPPDQSRALVDAIRTLRQTNGDF